METHVAKIENGKRYNRFGEQVIACKNKCGRDTTMLGTKLCDPCWGRQRFELTKPEESK